jgi:Flp pilus assembly protein TadD
MRAARVPLLLLALLLAALAVAYRDAGRLALLSQDDDVFVVDNPRVAGGLTAANVRWSLTALDLTNWYPLTWLSHQATVQLFGMRPAAHHLVNLLLHALASALLLAALWRMTGAAVRSAAVAALFALHPLHVESVAWVAERSDVLAGALWAATLLAYAGWARRPVPSRRAAVVLSFCLALLSKATAVTLPLVLLLLDVWPLGRSTLSGGGGAPGRRAFPALLGEKVPLLLLSAGASTLTVIAQSRSAAVQPLARYPLWTRLCNAPIAAVAYLKAAVVPTGLAFFYPHPGRSVSVAAAAGAGLLLLGITAAALGLRRARPSLPVGWLWYLVTLAPVIGVVQVGTQARADRYTYLPLLGVFVAACWALPAPRRSGGRGTALASAALLLLVPALVVATARQVRYWESSERLFERALQVSGESEFLHYNLGVVLARQGRGEEAIAHYRAALRADPSLVEAHVNLGAALAERGDLAEAVEHYREAVRLDPGQEGAWFDLGFDLDRLGDLTGAAAAYRRALELSPGSAEGHANLGAVYAELGRLDEAAASLERALRLHPTLAVAHYRLGVVRERQGRAAEALARYREARRLDPANAVYGYRVRELAARLGGG